LKGVIKTERKRLAGELKQGGDTVVRPSNAACRNFRSARLRVPMCSSVKAAIVRPPGSTSRNST
jgi:hypothetical protein